MLRLNYSTGFEGKRFGRWLVLSYSHVHVVSKKLHYWNCVCDCGTKRAVETRLLVRGRSSSCGCYKNEVTAQRRLKHGATTGYHKTGQVTRAYSSWAHMIQRCTNPNNCRWHRYGGRGIRICQGFQDSAFFLSVMGNCPSSIHSIDRKNNDGNYSCGKCPECLLSEWPMNCRWATPKEQSANQTYPRRSIPRSEAG